LTALNRSYQANRSAAVRKYALVHLEPTILNRTFHAGTVLGWRAFELIKERRVDLLDMNATVLNGLDAVGNLDDLARGCIGIGVGAGLDELHFRFM
jgi:hypothetical protein